MKKLIISIFVLAIVVAGCEKNESRLLATTPISGAAFVKVNYSMPFALNPAVQLKINGTRVSNAITYATPFPGGGLNTGGASQSDYLAIAPGNITVSISRPNVGSSNDSIVLFTGTASVTTDKYQTLHLTDTGANANIVYMEDNRAMPDSGQSRFVFVNLIPNVTGGVDLYHGTVKVASAIAYKASSPSFTLQNGTVGSWTIRPAGAAPTSTALATYANNIVDRRVFTVFARGYSGATGTRAPAVSLLYVR